MSFARRSGSSNGRTTADRAASASSPGKRTLTEHRGSPPVQRIVSAGSQAPAARVHAAAEAGTRGSGGALPHLDNIQRLFGRNDVSGVRAHTDSAAAAASRSMGAEAFAFGEHVAFSAPPTLHVAAHEAAHVVQQRAGVQVPGGVGEAGDRHEQLADAVAGRVERGESAEALLAPGGIAPTAVGTAVQQLRLGPDGQWDTANPLHYDVIVQHLRTLGTQSLATIRDMIAVQPNNTEQRLLQVIELELARARGLDDVQGAIDQDGGGIWTKAAVFVNGNPIGETHPIRSGTTEGDYSQLPGHPIEQDQEWGRHEMHLSSLDSEVGTLDEVTGLLNPYLHQPVQNIRIVLSGNLGPCDGCKRRLEVYLHDTEQLFPGATVVLESNYFTARSQPARQGIPTQYGYSDDQPRRSSSMRNYFTREVHAPH